MSYFGLKRTPFFCFFEKIKNKKVFFPGRFVPSRTVHKVPPGHFVPSRTVHKVPLGHFRSFPVMVGHVRSLRFVSGHFLPFPVISGRFRSFPAISAIPVISDGTRANLQNCSPNIQYWYSAARPLVIKAKIHEQLRRAIHVQY
jgi:hypothetical protein